MTIEIIHPETQALIEQRMASGAFYDVEEVLLQALRSAPSPQPVDRQHQQKKSLVEICAMVRGLADDLDFGRDRSIARPLDLS
jgi:hypothetical protein